MSTYGRVAELAGFPRRARPVGRALRELPGESDVPCHRVLNGAAAQRPRRRDRPRPLRCPSMLRSRHRSVRRHHKRPRPPTRRTRPNEPTFLRRPSRAWCQRSLVDAGQLDATTRVVHCAEARAGRKFAGVAAPLLRTESDERPRAKAHATGRGYTRRGVRLALVRGQGSLRARGHHEAVPVAAGASQRRAAPHRQVSRRSSRGSGGASRPCDPSRAAGRRDDSVATHAPAACSSG
ncbi:MAG TPA: MGMT family protein [Polyangia bacterium]